MSISSIDVFSDELLTFKDAAKLLPGRPHFLTLHRWAKEGLRGVFLQTVLIGNVRYTTRAAMNEFFTQSAQPTSGQFRPKAKQQRRKASC